MATEHVKDTHDIRWIRVDEIGIVWPAAQREINNGNVCNIVENFDPDALGILQVAEKNGKGLYHPVDGQHRVEALRRMGYGDQLIRAEVHDIRDAAAAAKLFDLLNTSRKPQALERFTVRVAAKAPVETEISRIVKKNGFHIAASDSPRAIAAVGALKELHGKFGAEVLDFTLSLIPRIWRDDPDAVGAVVIKGLGYVVGTHANAVDYPRLIDRLGKKFSGGNLIARARDQRQMASVNLTIAAMSVIVMCYNQGLKDSAKLELPI